MKWIKLLIEKLLNKGKIELIESPEVISNSLDDKSNFIINLQKQANLECNSRNGYGIMPKIRLRDMV